MRRTENKPSNTFSYKQSGTGYPLLSFCRVNKFWKIYALKQRFKGSAGELNVNALVPTLCFNWVSSHDRKINALDQIALSEFRSFLLEVQTGRLRKCRACLIVKYILT